MPLIRTIKKSSVIGLLSILLFACGGGGNGGDNTPQPPQQSGVAKAYLAEVLAVMQENAITRYDTDWGALETEVNQIVIDAISISDTYPAITRALELINTNHSFLNILQGVVHDVHSPSLGSDRSRVHRLCRRDRVGQHERRLELDDGSSQGLQVEQWARS